MSSDVQAPAGTGETETPRSRCPPRSAEASKEAPRSVVPIIDLSGLVDGNADAKASVASEIARACEDVGFFVVVNHGIPKEVVDAAWNLTLEFFDQPMEVKAKYITPDEAKYPYGYSPLGGETLSKGKSAEKGVDDSGEQAPPKGDLKEMFNIGPSNPLSGMPPRQMPTEPADFAGAWERYYDETVSLAERLLSAMAIALGLEETWFADKVDRHQSALRSNNYPDQAGIEVPAGSIRCSAHTDYGTLTILRSGGPGLQVCKDREGAQWHDVPFVEDGFVINLGDLMRRWTNDRWVSTLHRVVNPPASEVATWGRRLSLAFFHNLNKDAVVEAIPSCVSEDQPALYAPIVAGEFLMLKHLASQGRADPDAHLRRVGA